jgi:hypothetical protein
MERSRCVLLQYALANQLRCIFLVFCLCICKMPMIGRSMPQGIVHTAEEMYCMRRAGKNIMCRRKDFRGPRVVSRPRTLPELETPMSDHVQNLSYLDRDK